MSVALLPLFSESSLNEMKNEVLSLKIKLSLFRRSSLDK